MDGFGIARFNVFWFCWLLAPAAITWWAAGMRDRRLRVALLVVSILVVYGLSLAAVDRKWDLRLAGAADAVELERATRDGANRVFTALFIGPAEGLLATGFWYWLWRKRRIGD